MTALLETSSQPFVLLKRQTPRADFVNTFQLGESYTSYLSEHLHQLQVGAYKGTGRLPSPTTAG